MRVILKNDTPKTVTNTLSYVYLFLSSHLKKNPVKSRSSESNEIKLCKRKKYKLSDLLSLFMRNKVQERYIQFTLKELEPFIPKDQSF